MPKEVEFVTVFVSLSIFLIFLISISSFIIPDSEVSCIQGLVCLIYFIGGLGKRKCRWQLRLLPSNEILLEGMKTLWSLRKHLKGFRICWLTTAHQGRRDMWCTKCFCCRADMHRPWHDRSSRYHLNRHNIGFEAALNANPNVSCLRIFLKFLKFIFIELRNLHI